MTLGIGSGLRERRPITVLQVVIKLGDFVGHTRQSLTRNARHFLTSGPTIGLGTLLLEEGDRTLLSEIDVCFVHGPLLSARVLLGQCTRSGNAQSESGDSSEGN